MPSDQFVAWFIGCLIKQMTLVSPLFWGYEEDLRTTNVCICGTSFRQEKKNKKINFWGPETVGWGGGLPHERAGVKKFVL